MKNLAVLFTAAALVAGMVGSVAAAGPVLSIPASTLASMGLDGARPLSDGAGLTVRGAGIDPRAYGASHVTAGLNNNAYNSYLAVSTNNPGKASGGAIGFYGYVVNGQFVGVAAGGFSSASR
jgi:hypothetical protein